MESLNLQTPLQPPESQPQSQPVPPPTSQQPSQQQPDNYQPDYSFKLDDDLFAGLTGERKLSADSVVDEATGEIETAPEAAINAEPQAMDESEANKQARTLMDMRETGQALALSYIADGKLDDYARYKYEPWQKNLLIEAWAPIIQQFGLRVNPWIKVLYAEGVSTTPLILLSVQNRNQRIKIQQQAAYIAELQRENEGLRTTASAKQKTLRKDTKQQWKIDEKGYFEYNTGGVYIKQGNRTEKPDLNPEAYELLCKHNGAEFIDKIFGTGNG